MFDQDKADDFNARLEIIIENLPPHEAFLEVVSALNTCEDSYLNECIKPLNLLRDKKALDWIELNANRVLNISNNWGHLAASSHFTWKLAEAWLNKGRPLSLIAIDALMFCTTRGARLNQSLWMREINPSLPDAPKPEIVAARLQQYLNTDNVPRTRKIIDKIIDSIYEV